MEEMLLFALRKRKYRKLLLKIMAGKKESLNFHVMEIKGDKKYKMGMYN